MLFRYKISGNDSEDKLYNEWGIVAAASYSEAASKVLNYYGEGLPGECIYSFEIYEIEDVLPADELQQLAQ